jgi:hypothetical protein
VVDTVFEGMVVEVDEYVVDEYVVERLEVVDEYVVEVPFC